MIPPIIYTSKYLRTEKKTKDVAQAIYNALDTLKIEHRELTHTNDYWCRDYMPVMISDDGIYAGYKYCPDYLWDDKSLHKYITKQVNACKDVNVYVQADMGVKFDGGNYVRCGDKVVMTDKVFMENPSWRASELLRHLEEVLRAEIVILPWDMGTESQPDVTGHSDGMVAYLGDGRILLNGCWQKSDERFHTRLMKILQEHFTVEVLTLDCEEDVNSWCYLNYLKVPNGILLPCLSENADCESDLAAQKAFARLFPDCKIIPIYAMPLIEDGGALHCVTWELFEHNVRLEN